MLVPPGPGRPEIPVDDVEPLPPLPVPDVDPLVPDPVEPPVVVGAATSAVASAEGRDLMPSDSPAPRRMASTR